MAIATAREIRLLPGQAALLIDFVNSVLAAIVGTGGGKTALGYWWLHSRMETFPGNTWVIAEPTYNMLSKIILTSSDPGRPSLEQYLTDIGHHPRWISKQNLILGTDFGQIYLGSADNPDSMQGAAVKGFWLDEAGLMKQLAYHTATQRVAMMRGQILLTTTPYNLGWLKTDVADKTGTEGIHVERWRSIDRPGFPMETYELEKKRLPPWRFAMIFDALFERPAGLIYSAFNEKVCLINRMPIQPQWPVFSGHDFGTANPAALFYAQNTGTGDFLLFSEYLPGAGRAAPQHVTEFKKITQGFTVLKRVGGSHQEEEIRQLYSAHGWSITEPKILNTEAQIDRVIGMHQLNKIYVFNDLRNYLDEKRTFSRKLDEKGQPTELIEDEASFHLMAAERYLLADFRPETVVSGGELPIWRYR